MNQVNNHEHQWILGYYQPGKWSIDGDWDDGIIKLVCHCGRTKEHLETQDSIEYAEDKNQ